MLHRTIAPLAVFLACACHASPASHTEAAPRVRIDAGVVEGVAGPTGMAFRGIPYGAAPTGAWRWKPPRPVEAWRGVRPARDMGPVCPQPADREPGFQRKMIAAIGGDPSVVQPLGAMSEDCLSLNVWTTALDTRQPVMVWLHGGSDAVGKGGEEAASLAPLGVVVVTLNYRLGLLGFLAHPALTAESPHHASGNYGLLDQIEALRWVQRNIAAFGGDPARVTMFGHSAGGGAVLQLMASPLARGLLHRGIAQSGTLDMSQPLADAEIEGVATATKLGVPADDPLPALRAASVEQLLAVSARGYQGATDGWAIPRSGPDQLAADALAPVPLIIGATANEAEVFGLPPLPTPDAYGALVREADPRRADRVLALYPPATTADIERAARRYVTDRDFVCPARFVAATRRAPTWLYLYDAPLTPPAQITAFHGAELRPLFADEQGAPLTDTERRVSAAIRRYWVQFAATGDPNAPGLPAWPAYAAASPHHLRIADPVQTAAALERAGCRVFDEAWPVAGDAAAAQR